MFVCKASLEASTESTHCGPQSHERCQCTELCSGVQEITDLRLAWLITVGGVRTQDSCLCFCSSLHLSHAPTLRRPSHLLLLRRNPNVILARDTVIALVGTATAQHVLREEIGNRIPVAYVKSALHVWWTVNVRLAVATDVVVYSGITARFTNVLLRFPSRHPPHVLLLLLHCHLPSLSAPVVRITRNAGRVLYVLGPLVYVTTIRHVHAERVSDQSARFVFDQVNVLPQDAKAGAVFTTAKHQGRGAYRVESQNARCATRIVNVYTENVRENRQNVLMGPMHPAVAASVKENALSAVEAMIVHKANV